MSEILLCLCICIIHLSGRVIVILTSGLTSEISNSEYRGAVMALVFSMVNIGNLAGNLMYVFW